MGKRMGDLKAAVVLGLALLALAGRAARAGAEAGTGPSAGAAWYVDAGAGNDANDGRSPAGAWKSLARVNAGAYGPGDRILFRSGGAWAGQLKPRGSGAEGRPISIGRWGEGSLPLIDGAGVEDGVVCLHNQSYWEIRDLEIANYAPKGGDRRGVQVTASNAGLVSHVLISGLYIHDVRGLVGSDLVHKRTAAIYIAVTDDSEWPTRFDDVVVERCTIRGIDNQGIVTNNELGVSDYPGTAPWMERRFTNVAIRDNTVSDIAKNAMIVRLLDGGVVERNVCFDTAYRAGSGNTMFTVACRGTVFQFNEGYLNRARDPQDGAMYDPDLRSPGTVWQYSYSHDNRYGLVWFCTVQEDSGIVVRYNLSQGDIDAVITPNYEFAGASIYNNVIYVPAHLSPKIIWEKKVLSPGQTRAYSMYNNIVYNLSKGAMYDFGDGTTRDIDNNLFWGIRGLYEPEDEAKIVADPQFADPGTGGFGLASLGGYRLKPGSPAIDAGRPIADNGGRDFWGNPLYRGRPDVGLHEYSGESVEIPPVSRIELSPAADPLTLLPGESARLAATAVHADGRRRALDGLAAWAGSDPAVLGVDSGGRLAALAYGAAEATVSWGGATGRIRVEVPALEGIAFDAPLYKLTLGQARRVGLVAVYGNGTARPVSGAAIKIADPSIAAPLPDGRLDPKKPGFTRVTAEYGGKRASGALEVLPGRYLLSPVADAFCRAGQYQYSFYGSPDLGEHVRLVVKQGSDPAFFRMSFLAFDLSPLAGQRIGRATLRLHGQSRGAPFSVAAYATEGAWTEERIAWFIAPALGEKLSTAAIGAEVDWYEWDLTLYAQAALSAGRRELSVALWDPEARNQEARFDSREAENPADGPSLEISLGGK